MMIARTLIAAALTAAVPVLAQSAPAPVSPATPAGGVVAVPDRMAMATRIAGKLLPDGTYRKMMDAVMSQITVQMTNQMLDMPMRDLAGMSGMAPGELQKMGPAASRQLMAILDPAFEERMRRTVPILTDGMTTIITGMEPSIREGVAQAYAAQFSAADLDAIDRFFATPAGAAYAAKAMTIMADPAIMAKMQAIMPELMKAMPAIMQKARVATADLPKPKRTADLTADDKKKLAALLGTDPARFGRPAPAE